MSSTISRAGQSVFSPITTSQNNKNIIRQESNITVQSSISNNSSSNNSVNLNTASHKEDRIKSITSRDYFEIDHNNNEIDKDYITDHIKTFNHNLPNDKLKVGFLLEPSSTVITKDDNDIDNLMKLLNNELLDEQQLKQQQPLRTMYSSKSDTNTSKMISTNIIYI